MEPSLNVRIMSADIKGKVNDENVKDSCPDVVLGLLRINFSSKNKIEIFRA